MISSNGTSARLLKTARIVLALPLVWRSAPGWTSANIAVGLTLSLLPLIELYLIKLLIDAAFIGMEAPDYPEIWRHLVYLMLAAGGLALLRACCGPLSRVVSDCQGQAVTDHVRDLLHAKAVAVDLEYYETPGYYDTLHRAVNETPYRPTRIVNGLMQLSQNMLTAIALAALLFRLHWSIPLVLFGSFLPGVFLRLRYADVIHQWHRQQTEQDRKAHYLSWVLTGQDYAKEVRLLDLGPLLIGRFRDLRRRLRKERMRIILKHAVPEMILQGAGSMAVLATLAFLAYRTVHGSITVGDLVMYYQAFQRGQSSLKEALSSFAGLYEDSLFLSSFFEFIRLKECVVEPVRPKPVPNPIGIGIRFNHVDFHYPTDSRIVLKDICLTIGPGEVVALVGGNGSGKSTLIKLLCRLYDVTGGSITLDGVDLRNFTTRELRRQISVVFQDYSHYGMTARENIWFGDKELSPDDGKIACAAKRTGAGTAITRLQSGYDTILGNWFEGGTELSIGEWQKVALARGFVRDAQFLVLDEPTSALDAEAEHELFQGIRDHAGNRSVILISHRLSTVRMADRIYMMEEGRIIESGTDEDLLNRKGTYARLFEMQAQNYRL